MYAFGQAIAARGYAGSSYTYGYQGQEKAEEIYASAVTYKYRVEDSRIGRFFSVDPLTGKYPFYSPYQFSGNRVVDMVELEGLEPASTEDKLEVTRKYTYSYETGEVRDVVDYAKNSTAMSLFRASGSDKYYSWKDNNGNDAIFSDNSFQNGAWQGIWKEYETSERKNERINQKTMYAFCDAADNSIYMTGLGMAVGPAVAAEAGTIWGGYTGASVAGSEISTGLIGAGRALVGWGEVSLAARVGSAASDALVQIGQGDGIKPASIVAQFMIPHPFISATFGVIGTSSKNGYISDILLGGLGNHLASGFAKPSNFFAQTSGSFMRNGHQFMGAATSNGNAAIFMSPATSAQDSILQKK